MYNDFILAGVCLVAILLIVVFLTNKDNKKTTETFVATTQGGRMSETGAIRGPNIITDGMTNRPWNEMVDEINKTGYTNDGKAMLGATQGKGFDSLLQNQLEINDISKRASDGMYTQQDLGEISNKIAGSAGNNAYNVYHRGGTIPNTCPNAIKIAN